MMMNAKSFTTSLLLIILSVCTRAQDSVNVGGHPGKQETIDTLKTPSEPANPKIRIVEPKGGGLMAEDADYDFEALKRNPKPKTEEPFTALPQPIVKVDPEYPDLVRRAKIKGSVSIKAWVQTDGLVKKDADIVDEAALRAVMKWRFKPAMIGDKPASCWTDVIFQF